VAAVQSHLHLDPEETIWFEHGPSVAGSLVGCGLDHAHIHMIVRPPFTFDSVAVEAERMCPHLSWSRNTGRPYDNIPHDRSYFVLGSGERFMIATDVESAGSQYLRRVISFMARNPFEWDFNKYPHNANIELTIATFRELESAPRVQSE